MAKPGQTSTRTTRQSQVANDTPNQSMPTTDFLKHDDFLDTVKNAVKQAVREELKIIREELSMMSTRIDLNESRILSLEVSNDKKSKKIEELKKKLLNQSERVHTLENKVKDSEQYSRRNCLRIFGMPETKGEKTDDIVLKLAKEKLGIEIDRSHRTGSTKTSEQRDGQQSHSQDPATSNSSRSNAAWSSKTDKAKYHCPIIVKFTTYRSRQTVLKARRKLKQTGISIAEDLAADNYKILEVARQFQNVTAAWSLDGRICVTIAEKSDRKHVTSIEEAKKL